MLKAFTTVQSVLRLFQYFFNEPFNQTKKVLESNENNLLLNSPWP